MLTISNDKICQEHLAKIYKEMSGYHSYAPNEKEEMSKEGVCLTYGELLFSGVKTLMENIEMGPDDVFLDLGSGLGKCDLQLFMQTTLLKIIGIEASKQRHDQAQTALRKARKMLPALWRSKRKLIYLCENFLLSDWQGASIVYTCSTSFTQELLVDICKKIDTEPQVKQVLSLRRLPDFRLPLKKTFDLECSWDVSACHYYAE